MDINLLVPAERYTFTAKQLKDASVQLNGNTQHLTTTAELPQLRGERTKAGRVSFAPTSINVSHWGERN